MPSYSSVYIQTPEADAKGSREVDYYRKLDLDWQARSARAADNRRRRELGLPPKTTPVKVSWP
jgi:hypothetical protein